MPLRNALGHPGTYRDAAGVEPITVSNDGQTLRLTVRGVAFSGSDFDGLAPVDRDGAAAAGLALHHGELCSCEIRCDLPIAVDVAGATEAACLGVRVVLGDPGPRGGIDRVDLALELTYSGGKVRSAGTTGWFEDELLDLQSKLPEGARLRACITCGLSDYSPLGHGLFGGLACFRGDKAGYRAVTDKRGIFEIWGAGELVQETDLCPEYEPRRAGTGYRG